MATMPHKDNYRAEMDLANAHGVFALDPRNLTTPIRMAAFGHCANARTAMEVAAEMDNSAVERISGHAICTVGDFMEGLGAYNNRKSTPR